MYLHKYILLVLYNEVQSLMNAYLFCMYRFDLFDNVNIVNTYLLYLKRSEDLLICCCSGML